MFRQVPFVAAIALMMVTTLTAKGPTARLVIAGGGLATPITVSDASILKDSNVYHATFLGGIAHVYYSRNPRTGEGFVYLPAPGEKWYQLNASTILRNGLEGNWVRASTQWATALNTYLP